MRLLTKRACGVAADGVTGCSSVVTAVAAIVKVFVEVHPGIAVPESIAVMASSVTLSFAWARAT